MHHLWHMCHWHHMHHMMYGTAHYHCYVHVVEDYSEGPTGNVYSKGDNWELAFCLSSMHVT